MNRSTACSVAENQATVSSHVFWIILNDIAILNHISHIRYTNHSIRSRHLSHCMGKIDNPILRTSSHTVHYI